MSNTPNSQSVLQRAVLGSIVAALAGWTAYNLVWIAYVLPNLGAFRLTWYSFLANIAGLLAISAIFTSIIWIVFFLPLYLFLPRQSIFWRWQVATASGLAIGALFSCLFWPELGISLFPVIHGVCTSGAACFVASITYPHFHPDAGTDRPKGRVFVKIWLSAAVFIFSMIGMTVLCCDVWDYQVAGRLYVCTDSGSMDYLIMDWAGIHNGKWPAIVVKSIHQNVNMGDPDEILEGWSVGRLWMLWYSFFGGSILLSILAASFPWWRRGNKELTELNVSP